MNFKKQIEQIMIYNQEISIKLNKPISNNDYQIIDLGCPHQWSKELPKGYCAVYFYAHNDKVL